MAERRRGAALETALLDAAWEELCAGGYARFTMDAVVRRAGTSPPVLYRRWPHRDALVRATLAHVMAGARVESPDTGSLREDLLTLMRRIGTDPAHVQLIVVMNAHLADLHRETGDGPTDLPVTARHRATDALAALYERAADRGEIAPSRLTARVKALPFDLLRHEILLTFAPVPEDVLEEIVDTVLLPLVRVDR